MKVTVAPSVTRKIVVKPSTVRRISQMTVESTLGAEPHQVGMLANATSLGFAAVRQKLMAELRSTGGRPGFERSERRKIPVTEAAWRTVELVTEALGEEGFRPSPAQVASVMLSLAAQSVRIPETVETTRHVMKAARSLGVKSAGSATADG